MSEREQAVLSHLCKGLSNKEIATTLSISARTVQKHLQRVYRHLGVQTRAEAIAKRYSAILAKESPRRSKTLRE